MLALLRKAELAAARQPSGGRGQVVVALTHVRNLLTAPHILAGERGEIRVVGKPHPATGEVVAITKQNGKWVMDKSGFSPPTAGRTAGHKSESKFQSRSSPTP